MCTLISAYFTRVVILKTGKDTIEISIRQVGHKKPLRFYTSYMFCLCIYNLQLTTVVWFTVLPAIESSSSSAFITLSGRGEGRGTG